MVIRLTIAEVTVVLFNYGQWAILSVRHSLLNISMYSWHSQGQHTLHAVQQNISHLDDADWRHKAVSGTAIYWS